MNFLATTTFGLEAVLRKEIKSLGLWYEAVGDGYVEFTGDEEAMSTANLWLRTADKVFLELAVFEAKSFEELFEGVFALSWSNYLEQDSAFPVAVKSYKSQLSSTPACQSIVKKAVVKKLQATYQIEEFAETGAAVEIHVWIRNNEVRVLLNTSGMGLHKRGYRPEAGEAPLKETLAAGIIYLSEWEPSKALYDPFCGSGTLLIEAAMIANQIAPGLKRTFAFEQWSWPNLDLLKKVRAEALTRKKSPPLLIFGSDKDDTVLALAKQAAATMGLDTISFSVQDILLESEFKIPVSEFTLISNPPYGLRMGEEKEVETIYRKLGALYEEHMKSNWHILTAFAAIEKVFGKQAKRRKLYNGGVQCYLYSFTEKN